MIGIRKIKHLPAKLAPHFRIRHIRGRGVHSPFAYGIIRNALLVDKGFSGRSGRLFTYLQMLGTRKISAAQLQNLHNYCDYGETVIHSGRAVERFGDGQPVLHIFTAACAAKEIRKTVGDTESGAGAIAVLSPRNDKGKLRLCNELSAAGDCVSIDNRGFMLFFYGSGHAPRHYKL